MTPHEQWLFRKAFTLGFKASRDGFNAEWSYSHLAPDSVFDMSHCNCETFTEFEAQMTAMPEFVHLQEEALVVFATINDYVEGKENALSMSITVNGNNMDIASFLPPKIVNPTNTAAGGIIVLANGNTYSDCVMLGEMRGRKRTD